MLDASQVSELLPHGSGMSLLDCAETWDERSIFCTSKSHLRQDNPILTSEQNHVSILIEYAAQAAGVHAGILQRNFSEGRAAFVGAVKNITFHRESIPQEDSLLEVSAEAELISEDGAIYGFNIAADGEPLIDGKLVLVQP